MRFYHTSLGEDRFIFGYPFLYVFNPDVNWHRAWLCTEPVQIETVGFSEVEWRVNECQKEAQLRAGRMTKMEEIWI
jgi:hypothetical protein